MHDIDSNPFEQYMHTHYDEYNMHTHNDEAAITLNIHGTPVGVALLPPAPANQEETEYFNQQLSALHGDSENDQSLSTYELSTSIYDLPEFYTDPSEYNLPTFDDDDFERMGS